MADFPNKQEAVFYTTADGEKNYFTGEQVELEASAEYPPTLPDGLYRVIAGELYRVIEEKKGI